VNSETAKNYSGMIFGLTSEMLHLEHGFVWC
jgi:hypothetical protein